MSYSVNFNQQQYPVNFGSQQLTPAQIAEYTVAATEATKDESKVTDGVGLMSVFSLASGANQVRKYSKNTGKSYSQLFNETKEAVKADSKTLSEITKSTDRAKLLNELTSRNKLNQEIFKTQASLPNGKKLEKMTAEMKEAYKQANAKLTKAANAKTQASSEKLLKEAKTLIEKASGKTTAKAAQTVSTAAKTTAETAAKTAVNTTKAVSVGSKILKAVKGNALFAAIEGGVELFTNVLPTFKQLGAKSGMKQVGKSTAKVAASVGGWAAGAAIGAAIGSVLPGAGTAVGAVVGGVISTVCSLICSTAAVKVTEKIVGKDELELAQEKSQKPLVQTQTQKQTQPNVQTVATAQRPVSNPFALYQYQNPYMSAYTTQDNADNLLMMPVRGGLQFTA